MGDDDRISKSTANETFVLSACVIPLSLENGAALLLSWFASIYYAPDSVQLLCWAGSRIDTSVVTLREWRGY